MTRVCLIYLVLLTLLSACGSNNKKLKYRRYGVEEFYRRTGVIQYFLPSIPAWANFNSSGKCQRMGAKKYVNMKELMANFQFNYQQALQFQLMYNVSLKNLKKVHKVDHLPFREEERLFFNIRDKVKSKIYLFNPPKYKRVNIIWVDPALDQPKYLQRFEKFVKGQEVAKGHPILLSFCLGRDRLLKFIKEQKLEEMNALAMSYELLSSYLSNGEATTSFHLNLPKFLGKKYKIFFYLPKRMARPQEVVGRMKIKYY